MLRLFNSNRTCILKHGLNTRMLSSTSVFGGKKVSEVIDLSEHERNVLSWTVDEKCTVFDATKQMVQLKTGSLCVTRNDKVVGIITERDYLIKVLHAGRKAAECIVADIGTMDSKLIVASPDDTIQDCVDVMVSKNIRHLPVADNDGDVVALLDIKDIAKSLADERQVTLHTLDELRIASKMPIHDG